MRKLEKPPYYSAEPQKAPRTYGKGKSGNNFKLTNNAKYGTDGPGGAEPTKMSRSGGKGRSGNGFAPPREGPQKSSRSPSGSNTAVSGIKYGVGGGGSGPGTGYGVGGI